MRLLSVLLLVAGCGNSNGNGVPVDKAAIVRTCSMELSCLKSPPYGLGGDCVQNFQTTLASGIGVFVTASDLRRFVACAQGAADCNTALACVSKNHGPAYCTAHPGDSCDGDLAVHCDAQNGWALFWDDCAALGVHCQVASGVAVCTDGTACDPKQANSCSGSTLRYCDGTAHLLVPIDCPSQLAGAGCGTWTDSMGMMQTTCTPPGPPCTGSNALRCDGNTVVACLANHEVGLDCTQLGASCGMSNGGLDCVPVASECKPSDPDRCDGAALQLCVDGKWTDVDCGSFGAPACMPIHGDAACGAP